MLADFSVHFTWTEEKKESWLLSFQTTTREMFSFKKHKPAGKHMNHLIILFTVSMKAVQTCMC